MKISELFAKKRRSTLLSTNFTLQFGFASSLLLLTSIIWTSSLINKKKRKKTIEISNSKKSFFRTLMMIIKQCTTRMVMALLTDSNKIRMEMAILMKMITSLPRRF